VPTVSTERLQEKHPEATFGVAQQGQGQYNAVATTCNFLYLMWILPRILPQLTVNGTPKKPRILRKNKDEISADDLHQVWTF
jgi:hypothetical protein